jgi:hypothetical protein
MVGITITVCFTGFGDKTYLVKNCSVILDIAFEKDG